MKKLFSPLLLVCFSMLLFQQTTTAAAYQEGVHYNLIKPAQHTTTGNKIEITELFSYTCPHCHRFEPYLDKWVPTLGNDAQFRRMPAIFSARWELLARAYYVADVLGIKEKIHKPLFNAIHNEKKRITRKEHLIKFFEKYGVSPEKFNKTYQSFAVESKIAYAKKMSRSYQISGTPSLVINGKYRVEPGKGIGFQEMIDITNFLIEKERQS